MRNSPKKIKIKENSDIDARAEGLFRLFISLFSTSFSPSILCFFARLVKITAAAVSQPPS